VDGYPHQLNNWTILSSSHVAALADSGDLQGPLASGVCHAPFDEWTGKRNTIRDRFCIFRNCLELPLVYSVATFVRDRIAALAGSNVEPWRMFLKKTVTMKQKVGELIYPKTTQIRVIGRFRNPAKIIMYPPIFLWAFSAIV
jgi:hypothetical protein